MAENHSTNRKMTSSSSFLCSGKLNRSFDIVERQDASSYIFEIVSYLVDRLKWLDCARAGNGTSQVVDGDVGEEPVWGFLEQRISFGFCGRERGSHRRRG